MNVFPERSYLIIDNNLANENINFSNEYIKLQEKSFTLVIGSLLPHKLYRGINKSYLFIGDFFDPVNPKASNDEVIYSLYKESNNIDEIMERTYSIFGKWIIFELGDNKINCMGDPHTTKSVKFHTEYIAISDIATIISKVVGSISALDLKNDSEHKKFLFNEYKLTNWWCGNATLYTNIMSLLPNQMLEIKFKNNGFISFNLRRVLHTRERENINDKFYNEHCYIRTQILLDGFFKSLSNRKKFGLTVTGGKDSRILFSACNSSNQNKAQYFIIKDSGMDEYNQDLIISKKICESLNCHLDIFETINDKELACKIKSYFPEIPDVYTEYNYAENLKDTETVVYGLIPETISGYYYNRLLKVNSRGLADLARHSTSLFAIKKYDEWLSGIDEAKLPQGYTILDLFYWEHRGGRWGAQTVNVCDLFQDSLWGFNCREFYDMWLKTNIKDRKWPQRRNLDMIVRRFGSEYMEVPFEKPNSILGKIRSLIEKNPLTSLLFRQIYYKINR